MFCLIQRVYVLFISFATTSSNRAPPDVYFACFYIHKHCWGALLIRADVASGHVCFFGGTFSPLPDCKKIDQSSSLLYKTFFCWTVGHCFTKQFTFLDYHFVPFAACLLSMSCSGVAGNRQRTSIIAQLLTGAHYQIRRITFRWHSTGCVGCNAKRITFTKSINMRSSRTVASHIQAVVQQGRRPVSSDKARFHWPKSFSAHILLFTVSPFISANFALLISCSVSNRFCASLQDS